MGEGIVVAVVSARVGVGVSRPLRQVDPQELDAEQQFRIQRILEAYSQSPVAVMVQRLLTTNMMECGTP